MTANRSLLLRATLAGALLMAVFLLTLGHRTDYVGHFLAGYGGTLGVLALALAAGRAPLGWGGALWVLLCIGLGALFEASLFRLAIFDPVDFANQSLGACLAGAALVGRPVARPPTAGLLALSVLFLGLGFYFAFA